ncbi:MULTISPECIES: hypothetical protein [Protofrankia]|uniref:hypothetical protein n=1 Tax=Protofrankia TaxID=2994361 RepID=UPI00069B226E|nr:MULTISPECIES: hypothetical protein [Protofrankia]ONH34044.1 hypothetical protein BL254_18595 [Protofrankia sp. BMG5.30]
MSRTRRAAGAGEYAVTVPPAARPADLLRMWATLPDDVRFVEAFGDVEVTLLFQPVQPVQPVDGPRSCREVPDAAGGAVLGLPEDTPRAAAWMTSGERTAYWAGRVEALAAVRRALAVVLVPPAAPD